MNINCLLNWFRKTTSANAPVYEKNENLRWSPIKNPHFLKFDSNLLYAVDDSLSLCCIAARLKHCAEILILIEYQTENSRIHEAFPVPNGAMAFILLHYELFKRFLIKVYSLYSAILQQNPSATLTVRVYASPIVLSILAAQNFTYSCRFFAHCDEMNAMLMKW